MSKKGLEGKRKDDKHCGDYRVLKKSSLAQGVEKSTYYYLPPYTT